MNGSRDVAVEEGSHSAYADLIESRWSAWLEQWRTFLAFESISSDPEYAPRCEACAEWLGGQLSEMGFSSEVIKNPSGHPLVWAERRHSPSSPTVLFYGHYDVQPVDPLEEWESPPFNGTVRDGRMYARGSNDDKGPVFFFLKAVESLIARDELKVNLKVILEGEEECGSGELQEALGQLKDRLKSDVLLVSDTGTPNPRCGAITLGLRGIAAFTVTVGGLLTDLHSGVHGGVAPNPAMALSKAIAALHDDKGRVTVEGFYDEVQAPTDEVLALAASQPLQRDEYVALTGAPPTAGEQDYPAEVRRGLRPTVEVNGFHSGYGGPGTKTIIPRDATAKISIRLVKGQSPGRTVELVRKHFRQQIQNGLTVSFSDENEGGEALMLNPKAAALEYARDALKATGVAEIVHLFEGGSVPILVGLSAAASADPVLVGFTLPGDRFHAPNESFSLEQWRKGFVFTCEFLSRVASLKVSTL